VHPVVLLPFVWASERSFSGCYFGGDSRLGALAVVAYRAPMALRILITKK